MSIQLNQGKLLSPERWTSESFAFLDSFLRFAGEHMHTPNPGASSPSNEKPVLLEAINFTMRAIERRTRFYRNLVVVVSLTALASVALAVILRRWILLAGWLALPVYVACFLFVDNRIVLAWRRGVLKMRDERGLNLPQLEQTLSGFRHLPQATLRSMLGLLSSKMTRRGNL